MLTFYAALSRCQPSTVQYFHLINTVADVNSFYLYGIFNNGYCHNAALENYVNSGYNF